MAQLDTDRLEEQVKKVYRDVASRPEEEYHFEMGRPLAERLGYDPDDLDLVPDGALDSFAGVGYHFDLAAIDPGDRVLDLGSGSGTDAFVAGLHTSETGTVIGVDMTPEQLDKARSLADEGHFHNVRFREAYIEDLPFDDATFDVVISNGVINLSPDKDQVFAEANRVLRPGGRLAVSDINSEEPMPDSITSDADLWAACIGGAMQIDAYRDLVTNAGLTVDEVRDNDDYEFVSEAARGACDTYGVKSISLGATKPE